MAFKKGDKRPANAGRKAGSTNKVTTEFKEALNDLLRDCAPDLKSWIREVADDDKSKALTHFANLAEFCYPKLSRSDSNVKLSGKASLVVKPSGE